MTSKLIYLDRKSYIQNSDLVTITELHHCFRCDLFTVESYSIGRRIIIDEDVPLRLLKAHMLSAYALSGYRIVVNIRLAPDIKWEVFYIQFFSLAG